jgi:hypothetical protein
MSADPKTANQVLQSYAQDLLGTEDSSLKLLKALFEDDFDPDDLAVRQILDEI